MTPMGTGAEIRTENVNLRVSNRPADGHRPAAEISRSDFIKAAANDRLGRPILINQPDFRHVRRPEP